MEARAIVTSAPEAIATGIRHAGPDDVSFVLSTWLRHYRNSSNFAKSIRSSVFFLHHHPLAEKVVERAAVLVAHDLEEPTTIYSYLIAETFPEVGGPVVHFAYTKPSFRRLGLMRKLFDFAGIDPNAIIFTHLSEDAMALKKKFPEAIYDPYLFLCT